jgi:hypothetical protein
MLRLAGDFSSPLHLMPLPSRPCDIVVLAKFSMLTSSFAVFDLYTDFTDEHG